MIQRPDTPIPSENIVPVQVSALAGLTPSAALESLIQQNIDLTTRLNINLRRVADMERVVQAMSSQVQGFETQKEAFREELQVLHKRFQSQESKLLNYRLEKENAEKAYANLVIEHKSIKEKLEEEKQTAVAIQERANRFRFKIHHHIRPMFKSLVADAEILPGIQRALALHKKYRSRIQKVARPMIRDLKFQLHTYRERCERLEARTTEMSRKIEELLNHLRTKNEQFDADQKKLVGYHEDRWNVLNAKLHDTALELELMTSREQAAKDEITRVKAEKEDIEEKNITLHNRAISSDRRLEEIEGRYQSDIQTLQESLAKYESLWTEVSKSLDLATVQLEAANRLNSSLTEDLKQEREKSEELNTRIRHLKIQEVALQSARNAGPLLETNPEVPQQIIEESQSQGPIQKLESLFAEIESGDMGQAHSQESKNP